MNRRLEHQSERPFPVPRPHFPVQPRFLTPAQIDVVNSLQLLTAKPVTYLVNLSEKDYIRKKNKWSVRFASALLTHMFILSLRLPKIKAWIDTNNPGDPLIPFSVSLEERLLKLSDEDREAELKKIQTQSALGKITQGGYSSLDVRATPAFSERGSDPP